ncbi:ATP-dependent Clp protease proteolytic subunit [Nocardia transvalensis]|uniref:ATP-dependent Clp protease proteolytic subunit n=1 Tax=Nocardia transvalensis TaxID=37333 RepID=UPI0018938580|nr:ATP-dependent Clp protease proteolytic subunit [Nocardia transvalensis]MBF6332804.1 ATP-dependent Clp protease proteolytic subunit [Nocardia transvalensis]
MDKVMSDMFDERTILISGELGRSVSNAVVSQLLLLDAADREEGIRLYIDSTAGSLSDGFAICDTMNLINPEVSTWAIGAVGSVATLVLCSGAVGKRYALPGSDIILRQPGADEGLDEETPKPTTEVYRRWLDEMVRLLSVRTGKGSDTIARDLRNQHRLSAADSVAYGIVDQVMAGGKYAPQGN